MKAILLDPSVKSENIGDSIIRQSILRRLPPTLEVTESLPTQVALTRAQNKIARKHSLALVGGTNLLSSNMPWYRQWKIDPRSAKALNGKVVLMGVGWWQYQKDPNYFTRRILRQVLSPTMVHSVRDEYTKTKLAGLGFRVANTSCPTLWGLKAVSPDSQRPACCVVTLTDYNKNLVEDQWLIDSARDHYEEVYVWPQSTRDETYAKQLSGDFKLLSPTLSAYEALIKSRVIDYVGTRLHGGVRAFQEGQWGLIVAVDNRATEISRDTGLPVYQRGDRAAISDALAERRSYPIRLPEQAIRSWLNQFDRGSEPGSARANDAAV
ncbi:polysaccharide pyruvyl transferase family protein [Arthrobacter sp. MDT2-16]